MGAALALILGVSLVIVPQVNIQIMYLHIKRLSQNWTGRNCPVGPVTSLGFLVALVQQQFKDSVKLLYSCCINLHYDQVHQEVKMEQTFLPSILEMQWCNGPEVRYRSFHSVQNPC